MTLFFLLAMTLVGEDSRLGSNLDFEQSAPSSISSWSRPAEGYEAALDSQDPAFGQQSMRIRYSNAPVGTRGSFAQSIPAGPLRGKRVVLSGFVKTEGIRRGHAALWVRADDASRQPLALGNMGNFAPNGTTAWQGYEAGVVVSPAAETIVFGGMLTGDGAAWFDGFRLSVEEPRIGYNLDFEDNHPSGPKDWIILAPRAGFRAFVDSDRPQSGKHSLCIDLKKAPGNRSYVIQRIPAWKFRSKLIVLSVYIRTENVTGQAFLYLGTLGPNLEIVAGTPVFASATGNSSWTRYEKEHFVRPMTDTIAIGASLHGSGKAWFDDFKVEVLEIH